MLEVIPFPVPQQSTLGLGCPLFKFLDLTQTHERGRTPLDDWSACRRSRYLHNTQQTQRGQHSRTSRNSNQRS